MKILFITDLDGTLLRSDKAISKESCEILNRLISEGVAKWLKENYRKYR